MTKHKSEKVTLKEIIEMIEDCRHSDDPWYDVIGVDIEGLDEALAKGEQDDFEEASRIESEYIQRHENDVYEINWPDHVITPRYNSDASYQLYEEAE